jgi:hypothetical protein
MKFNRTFGTAALVLAMAAGTAGATLLAGEVTTVAKSPTQKINIRPVDSHLRAGTTVTLDGARIALPYGWTARKFSGAPGVNSWCLRARGGSNDACTVTLQHFTSLPDGVDLDREGFIGDAPQYICGDLATSPTEKSSTGSFGGRTAEVREFDRSCASNGKKWRTVQYFVPTAPAWGLIVMGATSGDDDIARRIVTGSTLPGDTAAERLLDRGTIRSVNRGSSGVTVTIERTRYDFGRDRFVDAGVSARYLVSSASYDRAGVAKGSRITLQTDGKRVTEFRPDPRA